MKDDQALLLHLRDAAQRIHDYTRDGRDGFMTDTKTQDAVIRNIEIIGEASKPGMFPTRSKLGDTFKMLMWQLS